MNRKRILFVDDEANVIEGLRRMLRKQRTEWDMEFVRDAAEALTRMAEAPFDVLVTDMQMPGMNGAELLAQVAQRFPDTARIVLSGHADEELTNRALRHTHQYLSKPTDADAVKLAVTRACEAQKTVYDQHIRSVVTSCDVLPSLSSLYTELTQAAESETAGAKDIAQIIARDMAMSAKLLQLVNSSFFGIGRQISSIEQTVTLLGMIRIKALVLTEHVFKTFAPARPLHGLPIEELWNHSVLVAEGARRITRLEGQGGDRPDQAFAAGLLHDIGIVVLAARLSDKYQSVLDLALSDHRPVWEVERELLGPTHTEVGAYLLALWGLPPRLVEAVALHHQPGAVKYDGLCPVTTVHAADALFAELLRERPEDPADPFAPATDIDYLQRIGLASRVEAWRKQIKTVYDEAETVNA